MKSTSVSTNARTEAPASLQPIYNARERRTIELVKQSIDALIQAGQSVSLSTVEAKSKELDPIGQGISKSAIDRNEVANQYYKKYRSYKPPGKKRLAPPDRLLEAKSLQIKPERDPKRVRQTYSKLTKDELITRLIRVETLLAQGQQQEHQNNDQLLNQLLKAEAQEDSEPFWVDESDKNVQRLLTKIEQLKSDKRELKARLMGVESLEAENEKLTKQNSHLMNRLKIVTADDRNRDSAGFAKALRQSKPVDFPVVEF